LSERSSDPELPKRAKGPEPSKWRWAVPAALIAEAVACSSGSPAISTTAGLFACFIHLSRWALKR
jgi:hypothetical protein